MIYEMIALSVLKILSLFALNFCNSNSIYKNEKELIITLLTIIGISVILRVRCFCRIHR